MNISQPNLQLREDYPLIKDPLIEMETSETMFLEPKLEVIHDASVWTMCETSVTNEIEEDVAPAPYEDNQYFDTCVEVEQSETAFLETKTEYVCDASLGNMSVMNEMEEGKAPVSYQENQYPAQSCQTSPTKDLAHALGAQSVVTNTSTLPASFSSVSHLKFQSCEILPPIAEVFIKMEPSEAMFVCANTEDVHDVSAGNTSMMNGREELEEENSSVSFEEMQFPGKEKDPATFKDVLAASCLRQEDRTAISVTYSGPDDPEDVAEENAPRSISRQGKRAQDESARSRVTNNMSNSCRGPDEKSHACGECSKAFRTASALRRHVQVQHRAEHPCQCEQCNAVFLFPSALKKHMRKHTDERPYRCEVCGATFKHNYDLTSHMFRHTGEQPFRCDVCSATFSRNCDLTRHMRRHTGERAYRCEVCSAAFAGKDTLKRHMERRHADSVAFSKNCDLNRDVRRHASEVSYRCKVCSAAFTENGELTLHMRTHAGEGPYRCVVCRAAFTENGQLTSHMHTHVSEWPYRCKVCSATFTRTWTLSTHMLSHTEEKPFLCGDCGKRFNHKLAFVEHTRTHTG